MKEYQEKYIANLRQVFRLNAPPQAIPQDAAAYAADRGRRVAEIRRLSAENTQLLRQELFPLLDDIASAGEEDIRSLEGFAAALCEGAAYLDLVLCYTLHMALITYARRQGLRDMLIRELYQGAMALFYMQDILTSSQQTPYQWKLAALFGEAAAYIRQYDSIDDMDVRGYIHRAMGNLALAYPAPNYQEGQRKMAAIRCSLQILTDPAIQAKSPGLPWDLYIYKSHQERTTGMGLLRAGESDPQILREVMESAEFVLDRQTEMVKKHGGAPALRWAYAYEAAQYHCGVQPLHYLLGWMEQAYMERDEGDYSHEGVYRNMFLPALYAAYLEDDGELQAKKRAVMELMYRRMARYVRRMPDNRLSESTQKNLLACLQSFIEYPGGILEKDFILKLVACHNPDSYASSRMAADVAMLMVDRAVDACPQVFVGSLGLSRAGDVPAHREALRTFAYEGCLLHNVGVLPFNNLTRHIGRSWLAEENEIYQCHVFAGRLMLDRSPSTRPYAWAALGHHRFYNGQGGYPAAYRREEDPQPVLTDLISAAVHLVRLLDGRVFLTSTSLGLAGALARIRAEAGVRIAPCWAQVLAGLEPALQAYLQTGQVRAYEEAFALLRGESPSGL
ncbi:hypothetical protein [Acutalibacter caecimuris]|uniref:hypothetical protein n=1 Tax=Acutalibacter caecimuris TaxID=3093657 RepID=UPI002AC8CA2A|nr:hypothetical protein [Acutalibacter sp. M00118]